MDKDYVVHDTLSFLKSLSQKPAQGLKQYFGITTQEKNLSFVLLSHLVY